MRQGPNNKRMRGRNNGPRKHSNSRNYSFESNGPDVKVRGNAQQIVEKYLTLARDATSAGDRINAESYYQFAEHYYRVMNANAGNDQRPNTPNADVNGMDENDDDGDGDERTENGAGAASSGGDEPAQSENGGGRSGGSRRRGRGGAGRKDPGETPQPDVTGDDVKAEEAGEGANA